MGRRRSTSELPVVRRRFLLAPQARHEAPLPPVRWRLLLHLHLRQGHAADAVLPALMGQQGERSRLRRLLRPLPAARRRPPPLPILPSAGTFATLCCHYSAHYFSGCPLFCPLFCHYFAERVRAALGLGDYSSALYASPTYSLDLAHTTRAWRLGSPSFSPPTSTTGATTRCTLAHPAVCAYNIAGAHCLL